MKYLSFAVAALLATENAQAHKLEHKHGNHAWNHEFIQISLEQNGDLFSLINMKIGKA